MASKKPLKLSMLLFFLSGCFHSNDKAIPDIADEPESVQVKVQDLADTAPAYGVALGGGRSFEVSLEPADSQKLRAGELAWINTVGSESRPTIQATVTRVSRSSSSEVGQALAWLQAKSGSPVPAGEFVFAKLTLATKKNVLTIPREAIYVKDGAPLVLKQTQSKDGKTSFTPTEVELGVESEGNVEIRSGLESKDRVAVQGGIGYLFPNFKEADDD
jgi:hypothetical protein